MNFSYLQKKLPNHYPEHYPPKKEDAQDSDLAVIIGDMKNTWKKKLHTFKKGEKNLMHIRPYLLKDYHNRKGGR